MREMKLRKQMRTGVVHQGLLIAIGSLLALGLLSAFLLSTPDKNQSETADKKSDQGGAVDNSSQELVLFCAAGIKPPVADAALKYAKEKFGTEIHLQYGGSGTLLSNLKVAQIGDLYLAADSSYQDLARKAGLVQEVIPLAKIRPVIAVARGNPKQIKTLDDLLKDEVKIALANPEAASVGKQSKKIMQQTGHWERINKKTTVFKPTVMDIAADVSLGAVDAAIVWDSTVQQLSDKLEAVHVPEFDASVKTISIGVLSCSRKPTEALRFARYLQAPEKGQVEFKKYGYEPIDGDPWELSPELLLYSGGVNRLAIEDTIRQFEKREGVTVNVAYNGCGILVSQINAGAMPDAYFACDVSYMHQVQDKFLAPVTVSETDMVIITKKGNPKNIKSLKDLARDGIKLGIAHEKQSALGALTKRMMSKIDYNRQDLYSAIQKNVKQNTPTADLLVNQLRVGGLDASIVYMANVSQVKDKLDIIPITEADPKAEQPIAIRKKTEHRYLMQRLLDAIESAKSREKFESHGFRWRIQGPTP